MFFETNRSEYIKHRRAILEEALRLKSDTELGFEGFIFRVKAIWEYDSYTKDSWYKETLIEIVEIPEFKIREIVVKAPFKKVARSVGELIDIIDDIDKFIDSIRKLYLDKFPSLGSYV